MRQNDLLTLLKGTGLPVAYRAFKKPPALPYLVYLFAYSDNFGADNRTYARADNYQIELYTAIKDLAAEEKAEKALDDADIYWNKAEMFIESEDMYQVLYTIEI